MINQIGKTIVGPIVFDYVMWVLKTAEKKNIKVLYFLARDGYLLHKIAVKICRYYKLNIECRYLYCSRLSLRMPTYGFIGKETWDLIFVKSFLLNLNIIFDRLLLTQNEKKKVLKSSGIYIDTDKSLNEEEFIFVRDKLINNPVFNEIIMEKSQCSFENIVSYFRQEKVLNHKSIGIVDSGWTGSMQRSLRQIFDRAGIRIKLTGFYFGSFYNKHDSKDGEYLNWYFSDDDGFWRKVFFCNNVLEAFLSAPHEMTLGYYFTGSKWVPRLKYTSDRTAFYKEVEKLDSSCMEYIIEKMRKIDFNSWSNNGRVEESYALLRRFMVFPKREEVEAFNKFVFCDDLSESYVNFLSGKSQLNLLDNYSIPKRLFRRLFNKSADRNMEMLFWPYGAAAYTSSIKKYWYRLNIILWEILRYYK